MSKTSLERGIGISSFRVKLALYFALLALLPLAALAWGLGSLVAQNERHRVDARLQAELRASLAAFDGRIAAAQAAAGALARSRPFQIALEKRDVAALKTMVRPDLAVVGPHGSFRIGTIPASAVTRRVAVVTRGRLIGTVVAALPFDDSLVTGLHTRSGLQRNDTLALLRNGRVVAASPPIVGGRSRYRSVQTSQFAVLTPQAAIDSATTATKERIYSALFAVLGLVGLVAFIEGRSIVRTLRRLAEAAQAIAHGRLDQRVPVRGRDEFATLGRSFNEMAGQLQERVTELEEERGRLRDAITRFGEALVATHDVEQLLRVIVEAAVEATGATGAVIRAGRAVIESGTLEAGTETLELPLTIGTEALGTLVFSGTSFGIEQRMTAASLASHAAVALDNARLHAIVERQALVDGITGLANRRQCEDALAHEIARAERFGTALTLVLADLDDFKAVNDLRGHLVGDDVLREFASVLRVTVREADLAGRWGGEEFLLVLPGTEAAGGAQLAERVRTRLAERTFAGPDGQSFGVTSSFGIAQFKPGLDQRSLFAATDRALYEAKRLGKNRVELDGVVRSF